MQQLSGAGLVFSWTLLQWSEGSGEVLTQNRSLKIFGTLRVFRALLTASIRIGCDECWQSRETQPPSFDII